MNGRLLTIIIVLSLLHYRLPGRENGVPFNPLVVISGNYPAPYLEYGFRQYLIYHAAKTQYWHIRFMDGGCETETKYEPFYALDISGQVIQPFARSEKWGLHAELRWSSLKWSKYGDGPWYHPKFSRFRQKLCVFVGYITQFGVNRTSHFTTGISIRLPDAIRLPTTVYWRYNIPLREVEISDLPVWQFGIQINFNLIPQRCRARWF